MQAVFFFFSSQHTN